MLLCVFQMCACFLRMFQAEVRPNGTNVDFLLGKGGFQGGRGADAGQEFYVENVFEELDSENEASPLVSVCFLCLSLAARLLFVRAYVRCSGFSMRRKVCCTCGTTARGLRRRTRSTS